MEAPSPRYILSRALFLLVTLVVVLSCVSFYKKKQRESAILADLKSICSDSSYFQQFYAEEAQKSLVRAVALIAQANALGIPPESSIDRALGIETKSFFAEEKPEEPTYRQQIIRTNLRANYDNFLKLGYNADFHTLGAMKGGSLPPIPSGPEAGKKPVIGTFISAALSPGLEKVIANLEIRPPQADSRALSDLEIAAAKQLAYSLAEAKLIEEPIRDKIIKALSKPAP
ncbi:MAG: hypothetical protein V4819_02765 [Verrucomicrobiota bacterium]